ncbi:MAG: VOC family protein [Acidimicrobiia bacterium]
MTTPTLGSILLGSANPDRLRAWYHAALAPDPTDHGFVEFGGFPVLIDGRSDVAATNGDPARVILNFHVDDAHATAAHLNELGVTWLTEVEERPGGWFGTLIDPDGNYVQIIQLRGGS